MKCKTSRFGRALTFLSDIGLPWPALSLGEYQHGRSMRSRSQVDQYGRCGHSPVSRSGFRIKLTPDAKSLKVKDG